MRIKVFQFDVKDGKVQENIEKVKNMFDSENLSETDAVVLPEMWTSGYDLPNIEEYAERNLESIFSIMSELSKQNDVYIIAGSVPKMKEVKGVYNIACVMGSKGQLVHEYSKMHLVPMLNDPEYLEAGNESAKRFTVNGENVRIAICYDLRFPELN